MKKLVYLLALLLALEACKKDNSESTNEISAYCSSTTFKTELPDFSPIDLAEDGAGNTYALGTIFGILELIKVDENGVIVWRNPLNQVPGEVAEIKCLNDQSIVIVSFEKSVNYTVNNGYSSGIYLQNGWVMNGCKKSFIFQTTPFASSSEINDKTYLSKLNADGASLWTKTFDESFIGGKCLRKIGKEDMLFSTISLYGRQMKQAVTEDSQGNITVSDTVNFPMDRNTIHQYRLNEDGNVVWETEINDVFTSTYSRTPYIQMTLSGNEIGIATKKKVYLLNTFGTGESVLDLYSEDCQNDVRSITKASYGNFIISGYFLTDPTEQSIHTNPYTVKVSPEGNVIWHKSEYLHAYDSNESVFIAKNHKVYDFEGNIIMEIPNQYMNLTKVNCTNGVTFIQLENSNYYLVRTDSKGQFPE